MRPNGRHYCAGAATAHLENALPDVFTRDIEGDDVSSPSAEWLQGTHLGARAHYRDPPPGQRKPLGVFHNPPDCSGEGRLGHPGRDPQLELREQLRTLQLLSAVGHAKLSHALGLTSDLATSQAL